MERILEVVDVLGPVNTVNPDILGPLKFTPWAFRV